MTMTMIGAAIALTVLVLWIVLQLYDDRQR
jgi:hypothetical protein